MHVRVSVRGFPCLRTCVDLAIGFKGWSGIPLAVAALPPLHEIYLHRTMPRRRLPEKLFQRATHSPRKSKPYLATARAVVIARLTAQMKPASSRATAVTATVFSLPLLTSARKRPYR